MRVLIWVDLQVAVTQELLLIHAQLVVAEACAVDTVEVEVAEVGTPDQEAATEAVECTLEI